LDQFFQRLEKAAGISRISQLKMAPSEKIINIISIDILKDMGNKI